MHACINQDKPVVGILSSWDLIQDKVGLLEGSDGNID